MFINIPEKKISNAVIVEMARLYESNEPAMRKLVKLYSDDKEKGVYGSHFNYLEPVMDVLRYETCLPAGDRYLLLKIPKTLQRREKRKFSRVGVRHFREMESGSNYEDSYKYPIVNSRTLNEKEKSDILKNINQYSVVKNYGVCDDGEQVKKHFGFLKDSEKKYVVLLTPVFRKTQPVRDGFRYHKHGEYIGTQELKHEYLYDDEHIERVYLFHVYEVKYKGEPRYKGRKYKIVNNEVFNTSEEMVAIYCSHSRRFKREYASDEKGSLVIPESVNIENENELYKFMEKNDNWLG